MRLVQLLVSAAEAVRVCGCYWLQDIQRTRAWPVVLAHSPIPTAMRNPRQLEPSPLTGLAGGVNASSLQNCLECRPQLKILHVCNHEHNANTIATLHLVQPTFDVNCDFRSGIMWSG